MKYQKVPPNEEVKKTDGDPIESKSRFDYKAIRKLVFVKVEAFLWVFIALLIFYKTKFLRNLLFNEKGNQLFRKIYFISTGASITIICYVTVIMPIFNIKKNEEYQNKLVLLTNFFLIFSFLSCVITVYPIYRWYTLLMIPIQGMGFLMLTHFIPFNGHRNTICSYLVIVAILWSGLYWNK